jgi:hypothetical protein
MTNRAQIIQLKIARRLAPIAILAIFVIATAACGIIRSRYFCATALSSRSGALDGRLALRHLCSSASRLTGRKVDKA